MITINKRIEELEMLVKSLEAKVADLSKNTEEKRKTPNTLSGNVRSSSLNTPVDTKTGRGAISGNSVIWNDTELALPPINEEPNSPSIGYNKHSHSRFSGGALIKDVLEIVEYVWGSITNKHSQGFLNLTDNDIATEVNSNGETVQKRGQLDLIFNPDTLKWGVGTIEIDVKKCYLVERDVNGDIALDSKGNEMKSLLWNSDTNKTSIVWDENARCFRFYSVYAPEPE
jgi:hypothetical protein